MTKKEQTRDDSLSHFILFDLYLSFSFYKLVFVFIFSFSLTMSQFLDASKSKIEIIIFVMILSPFDSHEASVSFLLMKLTKTTKISQKKIGSDLGKKRMQLLLTLHYLTIYPILIVRL